MKANELRLGNYIELGDEICIVNSIHEYGTIRLTPINRHPLDWKYESFNIKQTPQIQPIPLTEEWLLKFGFVWNGDIKILKSYLNDYIDGNGETMLKYVHQLQNLYFALTGEELEIKDI